MATAVILNLDTGFDLSQIIKITSNMDSFWSITPEIMFWTVLYANYQKIIYKMPAAAILNVKTGLNVD